MEGNKERFWWIKNLRLCNEKSVILPPPGFTLIADASSKGWEGGHKPGEINLGSLVKRKAENVYKYIGTKGSSTSHIDFHQIQRGPEKTSSDGQYGCFDLPYKDEGTHNKKPLNLSKEIWKCL